MNLLVLAVALSGQVSVVANNTPQSPVVENKSPAATEQLSQAVQRQIRRLDGRTVFCVAQQVLKGDPSRLGKWIVVQEIVGDPYGFKRFLDNFRAQHGLWGLTYDPSLSGWAAENNKAQCQMGLGHHVNPGCGQNSGWNYSDAYSVFIGWVNSSGHRKTLLQQGTHYGIAYGPGPYWTLNVR